MIAAIESTPTDAWDRWRHGRRPVPGSLRWLATTAAKIADAFVHNVTGGGPMLLGTPNIRTRALSTAWDDFVVIVAIGWRARLRPWWRRKLLAELERGLEGTTPPGSLVKIRVVRDLP